jgi:dUTP pyrophosphatase
MEETVSTHVAFLMSLLAATLTALLATGVTRYGMVALWHEADQLCIMRLRPDAVRPTKNHDAAGFDVRTCTDVTVPPHATVLAQTGWAARAPRGTYLRVAERSGLAMRNVGVGAGVIDRDYTGEIGVVLRNHGDSDVTLPMGTKIAQLIPTCITHPRVREIPEMPATGRGEKGFGSSG